MKEFPIFPVLLLLIAFFVLIIRPMQVRKRQTAEIQDRLRPGVEVMTTAGMFATVNAVEDDAVVLEVAPGVHSRYIKGAIARVIPPPEPEGQVDSANGTGPDKPGDGPSDD